MLTYTTLDGCVLDLSDLTDAERAYLERCVAAYRDGMAWAVFRRLVDGPENPVLRDTGGFITAAAWRHPVFRAVRDLEDRLGIKQEEVGAGPGDDPDRDPLVDSWLSVPEAAARKGVTVPGLHKAIKRGDVIARRAKPGGSWRLVSANSLAHWMPNRVRQGARSRASRKGADVVGA